MCGLEGVATQTAIASQSSLDCCKKCIVSMGLEVKRQPRPQSNPPAPQNQVTRRGVSGIDIMTKEEMELASDFHSKIRMAREDKGWSQSDLARRINEKSATIQKAENGIRPTDLVLNKISKSLGLNLFIESSANRHRVVTGNVSRDLTISDAGDSSVQPTKAKKIKKKGRKLGVSRSGARSRRL